MQVQLHKAFDDPGLVEWFFESGPVYDQTRCRQVPASHVLARADLYVWRGCDRPGHGHRTEPRQRAYVQRNRAGPIRKHGGRHLRQRRQLYRERNLPGWCGIDGRGDTCAGQERERVGWVSNYGWRFARGHRHHATPRVDGYQWSVGAEIRTCPSGRCGAGLNVPLSLRSLEYKHADTYVIQCALFASPDMRNAPGTVLLRDGGLPAKGRRRH